jgi:dienelactone hydrolase
VKVEQSQARASATMNRWSFTATFQQTSTINQKLRIKMIKNLLVALIIAIAVWPANSQTLEPVVLREGLAVGLGKPDNSKVVSPDAVVAAMETGSWQAPSENDRLQATSDTAVTWQKIIADDSGWFKSNPLYNGYVHLQFNSEKDDIALLEAGGHRMVYVNGVPRSGNPYRYKDSYESWEPRFDYSFIPIKLRKGKNEFLFDCNRGLLKALIHPGKTGLQFSEKDLTAPDIIIDEAIDTYGAIPIINTTEKTCTDLFIKTWADVGAPVFHPVPDIAPLSLYKTPFSIRLPAQKKQGDLEFRIEIVRKNGSSDEVLASTTVGLRVLDPGETRKETFLSKMDGSVQYFAVNPPENLQGKPALFLSLHGAGVEALNQAQAYGHKNWGFVVAPTNRRPYGYNWENWGRMDALEVLEIAVRKFDIDPGRIYLTGHSMGGHGTWHLGIDYADQFAAIGPSAGWISIWSYRIGGLPHLSPLQEMLVRSGKQSDTYAFAGNLGRSGIYIIHGALDDNVRPEQSYSMIDTLRASNINYVYHEQPGAGHWWDNSDEPGADCVDWRPMFDFFAHHRVAQSSEIKEVNFVTANPAITSKNYWLEIINQVAQQKLSKANVLVEFGNRKFTGTTENIETLAIDAVMLPEDEPVTFALDGQEISGITLTEDKKIYLAKASGTWALTTEPDKTHKYPGRCGNIREALNHDVVFVYGTHGSAEENRWALEKARYDAERIWYRGNGAIELIADDAFDTAAYKNRSVMLFGNANSNSAWRDLLASCPVQIGADRVKIGEKQYRGRDYACLMIRPRPDSEFASVGVVSGTGIAGMKLTNLAEYYDQYVGLPDIIIYDSDILESDDKGVKFTGYFGNDWSLEKGEFFSQ